MTMTMTQSQPLPKILVIDDDPLMRDLLKVHLEGGGYEVLVAEDGVSGGFQVLRAEPDLVIVDVDMPFMSGYDLVKAMKMDRATSEIPVVFLTGMQDVADQAAKLGAQAYILKPVRARRLLEVVALFT